ncbi:hypothetical protein [Cognatishimia sp. MH4019]|uniref:hypothetical protein n=1 Tax=Cognatishimia sp. MH4019 TaxID=2854030 RepID=UPI001CD5C475|nr:hypothetical protein [Cognatishimia sp. MH4019]
MKLALITAFALSAAAPAFADITSPAEADAQHGFETSFMADADLGKVSAAEIAGSDTVSTDVIIDPERRHPRQAGRHIRC